MRLKILSKYVMQVASSATYSLNNFTTLNDSKNLNHTPKVCY